MSLVAPTSRPSAVQAVVAVAMPAVPAQPTNAQTTPAQSEPAVLPLHQSLVADRGQAAERVSPGNVQAVRQWLQDSGYDLGSKSAGGSKPMLMVVNSSDLPATNAQVQQFLSSRKVSWIMTPSAGVNAGATTMPSANSSFLLLAPGTQATQPSGDVYVGSDVYVASGLTSKLADALRQSLAGNKDATIHVSIEPSMGPLAAVPSTQPAPTVIVEQPQDLNGAPRATQPSEIASVSADLTIPSTMPSNGQDSMERAGPANSTAGTALPDISGSRNTQPVDAVIVILTPDTVRLGPTTRAESAVPATQP